MMHDPIFLLTDGAISDYGSSPCPTLLLKYLIPTAKIGNNGIIKLAKALPDSKP